MGKRSTQAASSGHGAEGATQRPSAEGATQRPSAEGATQRPSAEGATQRPSAEGARPDHGEVGDAGVLRSFSADQRAAVLDALGSGAAAAGVTVIARDDLDRGDLPIVIDGETIGGLRLTGLHGALDRLVAQVEREIGQPVEALGREGKQAVVHRLDQLGAFHLRKAVEDIADRLHVSRFTVYNYLNSQP